MPTKLFFDQLLFSTNLYQNVKNQAFSSFCSTDTVDLNILQSDWPRTFWPISQEPNFSQVWDLGKNTAVNIHFLYWSISKKINEFPNKFKKPDFWLIFPILGTNFIPQKTQPSRYNTTRAPNTMMSSRKKLMD